MSLTRTVAFSTVGVEVGVKSLLFVGMLLLSGCGSAIPMDGEAADGERFIGSLTA